MLRSWKIKRKLLADDLTTRGIDLLELPPPAPLKPAPAAHSSGEGGAGK